MVLFHDILKFENISLGINDNKKGIKNIDILPVVSIYIKAERFDFL